MGTGTSSAEASGIASSFGGCFGFVIAVCTLRHKGVEKEDTCTFRQRNERVYDIVELNEDTQATR